MAQPQPNQKAVRTKKSNLGIWDSVARERYLFMVDLHLDGRVPTRTRKQILADLRNAIDVEAGRTSLSEALEGLGRPNELASSYAEGTDRSRPLWTVGVVAALGILLVYWVFLCLYTFGMLAVVTQVGGEFSAHFFFVEVMAFSQNESVGIGWAGGAALWFPLMLAFIAFISGSRAWRMLGSRRGQGDKHL
ncbi:hypothetical protein QMQ05_01840 [Glutamicibacter ectropisis]|uniref:DUF1700 domain-containing protein n=1 Tax=Glutamicibacter ectropisis TaxID=3046593 RepID=A0AAU6WEX9_9MICC